MVATSYSKIVGTITVSGIASVSSVKPITGNILTFRRYGYKYNEGTTSYNAAIRSLTGTISVNTNYANSNTSWLV